MAQPRSRGGAGWFAVTPGLVVETEIRVRYAETDAQGVVYYANHFIWFEVGRVAFLRELGLDYATVEREGIGFVVADASCRYHAPAHFDDRLRVRTRMEKVGRRSVVMAYDIVDSEGDRHVATGRTTLVFISMMTHEPIEIPDKLRTILDRAVIPNAESRSASA